MKNVSILKMKRIGSDVCSNNYKISI